MTTIYTEKIPSSVRDAMKTFAQDDCYLVKRRKKGLTGKGVQGNCHFNVQNWVESIGGQRIAGWLLYRNKSLVNKGIWIWIFHSVWKTPEGEVVDVTQDTTYSGSNFTTVWFDASRNIDMVNGTSYNNIVVFENSNIAESFGKNIGAHVEPGTTYWTNSTLKTIIPINDSNGKYKWIDDSFPNNIKQLESEYDCRVVDGKLVPNSSSNKMVSTKIFFDYSING